MGVLPLWLGKSGSIFLRIPQHPHRPAIPKAFAFDIHLLQEALSDLFAFFRPHTRWGQCSISRPPPPPWHASHRCFLPLRSGLYLTPPYIPGLGSAYSRHSIDAHQRMTVSLQAPHMIPHLPSFHGSLGLFSYPGLNEALEAAPAGRLPAEGLALGKGAVSAGSGWEGRPAHLSHEGCRLWSDSHASCSRVTQGGRQGPPNCCVFTPQATQDSCSRSI